MEGDGDMTGAELMEWIRVNGLEDLTLVVYKAGGVLGNVEEVRVAPMPQTGEKAVVIL